MEKKLEFRSDAPQGVRLHNPLNICKSKSKWQGAVEDGCKGRFVRFRSDYYGWRAAVIIMAKTYYNRGWNTPRLIIEHWAPYTENNTVAYIAFVAKYTGFDMDETMPPLSQNSIRWKNLLVAMGKIEIGYRWVDENRIAELEKAIQNVIENMHMD